MFKYMAKKMFGSKNERYLKTISPVVERINSLESDIQKMADQEFPSRIAVHRQEVEQGRSLEDVLPEVFALVREAARRTVDMRPFDVQLLGGVVLHQGRITEMKTGEGKTLVATMPMVLNALTGKGCT